MKKMFITFGYSRAAKAPRRRQRQQCHRLQPPHTDSNTAAYSYPNGYTAATATPTATATATATPRPTPTPRTMPTPRGRPTPRPRP